MVLGGWSAVTCCRACSIVQLQPSKELQWMKTTYVPPDDRHLQDRIEPKTTLKHVVSSGEVASPTRIARGVFSFSRFVSFIHAHPRQDQLSHHQL